MTRSTCFQSNLLLFVAPPAPPTPGDFLPPASRHVNTLPFIFYICFHSTGFFLSLFPFLSGGASDFVRFHHLRCFHVRHHIDRFSLSNGPQNTRNLVGGKKKKIKLFLLLWSIPSELEYFSDQVASHSGGSNAQWREVSIRNQGELCKWFSLWLSKEDIMVLKVSPTERKSF